MNNHTFPVNLQPACCDNCTSLRKISAGCILQCALYMYNIVGPCTRSFAFDLMYVNVARQKQWRTHNFEERTEEGVWAPSPKWNSGTKPSKLRGYFPAKWCMVLSRPSNALQFNFDSSERCRCLQV